MGRGAQRDSTLSLEWAQRPLERATSQRDSGSIQKLVKCVYSNQQLDLARPGGMWKWPDSIGRKRKIGKELQNRRGAKSPVIGIVTRSSLVVQCLRTCLAMQGTRVRYPVREDPTCYRATKPVCHYDRSLSPLKPVLHNKRSHNNEKLTHCNWRAAPTHHS